MVIEKIEVSGFEAAIRGMRNPMMSHAKSDSELWPIYRKEYEEIYPENINCTPYWIGGCDLTLAKNLQKQEQNILNIFV